MLEDEFKCLACGNTFKSLLVAKDRAEIKCMVCGSCETQKVVAEAEFGCEVNEKEEN